jgi:hypothetical protein
VQTAFDFAREAVLAAARVWAQSADLASLRLDIHAPGGQAGALGCTRPSFLAEASGLIASAEMNSDADPIGAANARPQISILIGKADRALASAGADQANATTFLREAETRLGGDRRAARQDGSPSRRPAGEDQGPALAGAIPTAQLTTWLATLAKTVAHRRTSAAMIGKTRCRRRVGFPPPARSLSRRGWRWRACSSPMRRARTCSRMASTNCNRRRRFAPPSRSTARIRTCWRPTLLKAAERADGIYPNSGATLLGCAPQSPRSLLRGREGAPPRLTFRGRSGLARRFGRSRQSGASAHAVLNSGWLRRAELPSCGSETVPEANFCGRCGGKLKPAAGTPIAACRGGAGRRIYRRGGILRGMRRSPDRRRSRGSRATDDRRQFAGHHRLRPASPRQRGRDRNCWRLEPVGPRSVADRSATASRLRARRPGPSSPRSKPSPEQRLLEQPLATISPQWLNAPPTQRRTPSYQYLIQHGQYPGGDACGGAGAQSPRRDRLGRRQPGLSLGAGALATYARRFLVQRHRRKRRRRLARYTTCLCARSSANRRRTVSRDRRSCSCV